MKHIQILIALVFLVCSCKPEDSHTISYTISPESQGSTQLLKIKAKFKPGKNGKTILKFQDNAWGEDSLYNVIHSMRLLTTQAEIIKHRDSGYITIKHSSDLKTLEFEYKLKQDTQGGLTTRTTYRPVIQPEYFQLFSHNMFMLPKHILSASEDNFNVTIDWKGFPENYQFQNSFGSQKLHQQIFNISEEAFHTAVFVGGDFRLHHILINDNKVAFAIRDNWQAFNDSVMVEILRKTMTVQRDFWKDHSQDYFSVTMIPTTETMGSSFQGTGLTNSFATAASNNNNLEVDGLVYLFNHELQHNWIGQNIKNDNEEAQYWFSEGFTDYYTIKNIASHEINGLDYRYFINELNNFIRALHASPVKEAPNSEINYDNFWSDRDYSKLPYRRGALFAFYLDYKIRQDTQGKKTLDDLMLDFKAKAETHKITHAFFIESANVYLKEDLTPFFNNHIEDGRLIDLKQVFDDLGLDYRSETELFDLGFQFSEDKRSVETIDETSNAHKAGLRKGDLIISRSYQYDRTDSKAEFIVRRESKEISVAYFPVRKAAIPQLKATENNRVNLAF